MADEAQYSAGADAGNNKRKYDEQTAPPLGNRRPTGFSSPEGAPPSYHTVAPPLDGIEMAKQKAQQIAARLNAVAGAANAADVKRPRVENGSSGFDSDRGFSSAPPPDVKLASAPSAIPVSYGGYQGTSKRIDIPQMRVGVIIGKAGETIKYLQLQSGAKIQVQRDMDADHNSTTRPVELMGTAEQIAKAEQLINDVLAEAEAGGSGIISRRVTGQAGSEHFEMRIPNNKVGLVIGKGGETIKSMQARTGARVQVIPLHLPPGDPSTERSLHIDGTGEQIKHARELVDEVISENRMRNPAMGGGYPQQGYQARPPTNWAPSGAPMQQSTYGYVQPGQYLGPSPQYNMSQPPYAGYPPQPTSGGYSSGWDQSTVPQNQQVPAGSGYDYYNQQPSQQQQTPGVSAAPTDNTGYNYGQPPASGYNQQGQGYPQDGYSGYNAQPQSGYGQPPPYDQHQGYGSVANYGNITNPSQEGSTPSYGAQGESGQAQPVQPSSVGQQAYGASQQPSINPGSYPPQGSSQPGYVVPSTSQTGYGSQTPVQSGYGPSYGPPQGQKPMVAPAYGQAQQSPRTYGQSAPVQPGYPHSQPPTSGYEQPDSGSQHAPAAGYTAQSSKQAYPPPYGAPPGSQPGYGQQQPYNSSYGGGYTQPPAYPPDGNAAGTTRGSYDAASGTQSGQQSAVAKASPQS